MVKQLGKSFTSPFSVRNGKKEQLQADYFALDAWGHQQCPTAESFVLLEPSLIVTVLGF